MYDRPWKPKADDGGPRAKPKFAPRSTAASPAASLKRLARPLALVVLVVVAIYQWNPLAAKLHHYISTAHRSDGPWLRVYNQPGALVRGSPERALDAQDSFKTYKQSAGCRLSSLDLHAPFEPLCADKASLLDAMTNGGRAGFDAPFSPRGCDMRWFSTGEICEILDRFDTIHMLGDSMIRYLTDAMHIFLRKDLVRGASYNWRPQEPAKTGGVCECERMFITQCGDNAAVDSEEIWAHAPETMACPKGIAMIKFQSVFQYPIDDFFLSPVTDTLPKTPPARPHAFVLGHGLWSNLNITAGQAWIEQLHAGLRDAMPWLDAARDFPYLFIPPVAAGDKKPPQYLPAQGNENLQVFHHEIRGWLAQHDPAVDYLGVYNMTVQGLSPDGTHAGMRGSLIKAMMVFNWLDAVSRA